MSALRQVFQRDDSLTVDLQQFLCGRYWLTEPEFPLCHDIFAAMGLTGDDCDEFMENFSVLFNVDLSDFVWPKFHLAEAEAQDVRAALRPLMRLAGLKTQPLNRDLVPISIDHLFTVAELGRWVDPAPKSPQDQPRVGLSRNIARFSARLRAGGVPRRPNR